VKIFWTEPALDELLDIYQFLLDNAGISIAKSIIDDILNTDQIEAFPESGTIEANLKKTGKEYRYILRGHKRYKIIYRIEGNIIYITDVFDCRKDPSSMKA
jgi:plasmid stabilization system protein ParE